MLPEWLLTFCLARLYFMCISILISRWFCGYWAWGVCKPLNSTWSQLWKGADWRHPGAASGAWQRLLHLRVGELPAQLLWQLHPFIVSDEGTHPGHATRDPPWLSECSHVQTSSSLPSTQGCLIAHSIFSMHSHLQYPWSILMNMTSY